MTSPHRNTEKIRERVWQVMRAALDAVEPGAAVRRHLHLTADHLTVVDPQDS